jgi:hypothetical protein
LPKFQFHGSLNLCRCRMVYELLCAAFAQASFSVMVRLKTSDE